MKGAIRDKLPDFTDLIRLDETPPEEQANP